MALSKILALLSLVAALLLLAHALPSHRGDAPLLDRLHDLATRRNMVLLCHAILLVLLGDAGLLSHPARRRRAEATACHYSSDRSHARSNITWRRQPRNNRSPYESHARNAAVVAVEKDPWAATSLTTEHGRLQVSEHVSTKEIVLVERQGTCLHGRYLVGVAAGELDQPAAMDGKTISPMDLDRAVVGDQEKNGAWEETAERQVPEECGAEEEDLDEMNRRFEQFIAITKEKMRLETLHLSAENRLVLA